MFGKFNLAFIKDILSLVKIMYVEVDRYRNFCPRSLCKFVSLFYLISIIFKCHIAQIYCANMDGNGGRDLDVHISIRLGMPLNKARL